MDREVTAFATAAVSAGDRGCVTHRRPNRAVASASALTVRRGSAIEAMSEARRRVSASRAAMSVATAPGPAARVRAVL